MAKLTISTWEYNTIANEHTAFERALECLLNERGVDELTQGNVYVYRAETGVGAYFVDEHGNKLRPIDYAFTEYGIETGGQSGIKTPRNP